MPERVGALGMCVSKSPAVGRSKYKTDIRFALVLLAERALKAGLPAEKLDSDSSDKKRFARSPAEEDNRDRTRARTDPVVRVNAKVLHKDCIEDFAKSFRTRTPQEVGHDVLSNERFRSTSMPVNEHINTSDVSCVRL